MCIKFLAYENSMCFCLGAIFTTILSLDLEVKNILFMNNIVIKFIKLTTFNINTLLSKNLHSTLSLTIISVSLKFPY